MRAKINQKVSVLWSFQAPKQSIQLHRMIWQNRIYALGPVDFHHTSWDGRVQVHYFSLADKAETMYFKLAFDTKNLHWKLEEVADELGTR